ncbi:MAG: hypothetical protein ACE5HO_10240 [bacterium]
MKNAVSINNYMKKRQKYILKARASDKIRDFFIVHYEEYEYIMAARVRNTKFYVDLFRKNGFYRELGEYTKFFGGGNLITMSNLNDMLYVLKWPELDSKDFEAIGNPEIVVYKIELARVLRSN